MYKQALRQIANSLYINIQHVNNIGLLNGITGCTLFLYKYADYSKSTIYSKLADELLEMLYDKLTTDLPLNFCNGLSGIAWGLQNMAKNKYVEMEENALQEIENFIYNIPSTQYETDLQSELPLFSKGIYALETASGKEFLCRIITECEEFISTYTQSNIALSYLNSVLYFISGCKNEQIHHPALSGLTDLVYDRLLISLMSNPYMENEKRNLLYLISLLISHENLIREKEKWETLKTRLNAEVLSEQEINFNWLNLLSGKAFTNSKPEGEFKPDINKHVENKIQHLTRSNLGLQNGLTGLGYFLMKKN